MEEVSSQWKKLLEATELKGICYRKRLDELILTVDVHSGVDKCPKMTLLFTNGTKPIYLFILIRHQAP